MPRPTSGGNPLRIDQQRHHRGQYCRQTSRLSAPSELRHTIPRTINFRANVWAFKKLGVSKVIAPCAVGSLKQEVKPGQFVFCDQYVNRTYRRVDTFFDGPVIRHVSAADPYDEQPAPAGHRIGPPKPVQTPPTGTVVVIEGPRFSTRASDWAPPGWLGRHQHDSTRKFTWSRNWICRPSTSRAGHRLRRVPGIERGRKC
ncbi:MAG: hypothetical protein R2857_10190 [Vampirovibrionales bacterium]